MLYAKVMLNAYFFFYSSWSGERERKEGGGRDVY
jgi:hypothetical protein